MSAKRRIIALNKKDLANPNMLNVKFLLLWPLCFLLVSLCEVEFLNFAAICRNGLIISNPTSKIVSPLMLIAEALSRRLDDPLYIYVGVLNQY